MLGWVVYFEHLGLWSPTYSSIKLQIYSLSYLQASCWTQLGFRVSLRMTLAPSSPPCSQMCRYSCHWMTLPCTSLSLLTWGCPCVAWRFSTNHWPLQHLASWSHPSPTALWTQPPLLPLPQRALPFHFLWHFLSVAGWSTDSSFSFSAQTPPPPQPLHHSTYPLPPTIFSLLACEKAVYLTLIFLFQQFPPFACFFPCLSFLFCLLLSMNSLIWWFEKDNSLWLVA